MSTFVLVPGGWHGGWWFEPLAERLRAGEHMVYALTLTGLQAGGGVPTLPGTNLETHIRDLVQLLERESISDAIVCGHSYGGLVIAGAADQAPERICAVVYVDAYVPSDGDSCWSLTTDRFRRLFVEGSRRDGYVVEPPTSLDPRANPHPLACFLQAIKLSDDSLTNTRHRKIFVYLSAWRDSPFAAVYERLRSAPNWELFELNVGH